MNGSCTTLLALQEQNDAHTMNVPQTPQKSPNGEPNDWEVRSAVKRCPKGTLLFVEGSKPEAVRIIREGSIKLSSGFANGHTLTLGIAGPGEVLGLAAVVAGAEHECTAEALEDCKIDVICRDDLLRAMKNDSHVSGRILLELSETCLRAHQKIGSLARHDPVLVKLARLFLSWLPETRETGAFRVINAFTHQQMAEIIGSSRETVTRALRDMRERRLVTVKGSSLLVHDREKLRDLTGMLDPNRRAFTAQV